MEGRTLGNAMIRLLLLAILLLSGLPTQAGAAQPSAPVTRIANHPADQGIESWKANTLKPFGIRADEPTAAGARNITITVDQTALLTELAMLQEHGALSRSIAGDDVEKRPASYTNVLSLLLTSYVVRDYQAGPTWRASARR